MSLRTAVRRRNRSAGGQKTARLRPGRLRTRTKGCGVLGVGALDTEATRCPECGSILNQGRGCCNLVFTLISRQVFPLAGCCTTRCNETLLLESWYIQCARLFCGSDEAPRLLCRRDCGAGGRFRTRLFM